MNYFNYFTEIEDAFVRRRGKHLLLSPIDWAMMEAWKERGIPLHIVLRGIESVFDNFNKNPRPRTIKSLIFCREEIEAQFTEWSAMQVGRANENAPVAEEGSLSRETINDHISGIIGKLKDLEIEPLKEQIERALSRLSDLNANLSDDPEQTDKSLTDIENFLDNALLSNLDGSHLKKVEKEIAAQLRQYKAEMDKEAYENMLRLMLLKRFREDLCIPRMSLFYL